MRKIGLPVATPGGKMTVRDVDTGQRRDPAIMTQLQDPANILTMLGLILGATAIHLAQSGAVDFAVVCGFGALLIDHADGVVARRLQKRPERAGDVGRMMDSLADIVSAGVLPAVIVVQVSHGGVLATTAGIAIIAASGLRLSYFSAFGLQDGKWFHGVPVTYVLPVVGGLVLLRGVAPWSLGGGLGVALLGLAALEVSNLRVRTLAGRGYLFAVIYAVAVGTGILVRHWVGG